MSRKSQYRNVTWYRRIGRWIAKIHLRGLPKETTLHLGYYRSEEDAARVADAARVVLNQLGLLDGRTDPRPSFDGKPPDSVSMAEILQMMLDQEVISPADIMRILHPTTKRP